MTEFCAVIGASINPAFAGKKWNGSPVGNTANFAVAFNGTGFTSLKQMLDRTVPGCANTRTDIPPVDVANLTTLEWRNDEKKMGFVDTHHGPCEVWIDDTRVFQNDDCAANYRAYPAVLPINYAECVNTNCMLTIIWLAVHKPEWEIYKQCVPITFPVSLSVRNTKSSVRLVMFSSCLAYYLGFD
ncbi:hypothetical protein PybrP1_001511 [[Pythium] brassicae (nom. inval.)]|nr:hypothetical protein PybrP1_001511 [[Pythium] brassicae (nom. inval.)]